MKSSEAVHRSFSADKVDKCISQVAAIFEVNWQVTEIIYKFTLSLSAVKVSSGITIFIILLDCWTAHLLLWTIVSAILLQIVQETLHEDGWWLPETDKLLPLEIDSCVCLYSLQHWGQLQTMYCFVHSAQEAYPWALSSISSSICMLYLQSKLFWGTQHGFVQIFRLLDWNNEL